MRYLLFLLLTIPVCAGLAVALEAGELETGEESRWFDCQADSDCTWILGRCGHPQAVNAEFREELQSFIDHDPAEFRCKQLCRYQRDRNAVLAESKSQVTCRKSRCVICFSPEQLKRYEGKCSLGLCSE